MSAESLVTFEDIYKAIIEELKIQATDGNTIARIKRDINMIYLQHVIPFKPRAWWWLELNQVIVTSEKITTGTVSMTEDSTTITFSSAPADSMTGFYIKFAGYPEVIKISAHTAAATTATLEIAWPHATQTGQGYKMWKDNAPLSSEMKEVTMVTHDRYARSLDALNNIQMQEQFAMNSEVEGYPMKYNTGDFDSDNNRLIRWYPACSDTKVILKIKGVQEAPKLDADDDEPLMPVEDRIVLFYGAASRAWRRERNTAEATANWNLFVAKLTEMAGKSGDAPQITEMRVNRDYLQNKRYRRWMKRGYGRRWESSD